jgi:hypothetical protein
METIQIDNDIDVFYVTASSFPEGIMGALEKIHALAPPMAGRRFFGVSRPEGEGEIVYRAAAEQLREGEARELGCDSLTLFKGRYITQVIEDYPADLAAIGRAFDKLLSQPGLDPKGYCVEWYLNDKDVRCMVRLEQ